MAEIQEIAIEPEGAPEATPEIEREIPTNTADIPNNSDPPKRGRGRPTGSKNKPRERAPPPAPKKQAAPKPRPKKKEPLYAADEEESSEEETPPPRTRRGRATTPEPLDRAALAADVLGLLQQQKYARGSARRNHYASWFQNM